MATNKRSANVSKPPASSTGPNTPHGVVRACEQGPEAAHDQEDHPARLGQNPAIKSRPARGARRYADVGRQQGSRHAEEDNRARGPRQEGNRCQECDVGHSVSDLIEELPSRMYPTAPPSQIAVEQVEHQSPNDEHRHSQQSQGLGW